MRVTLGTKYNQFNHYNENLKQKLSDVQTKIASGLKIQNGYEDPSLFSKVLKLDTQSATVSQNIDTANAGLNYTTHANQSLREIFDALLEFKNHLIQAANNTQSEVSRKAIASQLSSIKNQIIDIGNTSIAGNYLFAGSQTHTAPFDSTGNYRGNNQELSLLISPNYKAVYNITGEQLFLGTNENGFQTLTTDIPLLNQTFLHPQIMQNQSNQPPRKVYLQASDTIRDLMGDGDSNSKDDQEEFFYIQGIRPDGSSFKSKFSLQKAYDNLENAITVQNLLDEIAKAYGNTPQDKVVDVSLNNWGQIQIQSLKPSRYKMQFFMISSDQDVDNISDLYNQGSRIQAYTQGSLQAPNSLTNISSTFDLYNKNQSYFDIPFVTQYGQLANKNTPLKDIFGKETFFLSLKILDPKVSPPEEELAQKPNNENESLQESNVQEANTLANTLIVETKNQTIEDLLREIREFYGENIDADFINGRLFLTHKGGEPTQFELATLNTDYKEIPGIPQDSRTQYDRVFFLKKGSTLVGNIPQRKPDGTMADNGTKLSEVSKSNLENTSFDLKIHDYNDVPIDAKIQLGEKSYLILPSRQKQEEENSMKEEQNQEYKIPIYGSDGNTVKITPGNEVSYRQLLDTLAIALNYSNQPEELLLLASSDSESNGFDAYRKLLKNSENYISTKLDTEGNVIIQDRNLSNTKMDLMFANSSSQDFSQNSIYKANETLVLNTNGALTVTGPKINFFKQMDEIIDAVNRGILYPGEENIGSDTQNIGIINGISVLDNLANHIQKYIALNGVRAKTFENQTLKNETLKNQIESLKSQELSIDPAQTYNKLSELNNNYNALLSTTSKINKISLENYLK